ncbi:MAG: radical SAM protein [Planctomycetales bacterium]|nr:radical SAM protein [Planctomycetales bacterium]
MSQLPRLTDSEILAARGAKNPLSLSEPYASYVEPERTAEGLVEQVATLLLTNRECPFRCAMCDLWRNTLDDPTPAGAVPDQVRHALSQLPPTRHVKLYNSGNFFDAKAIPVADRPRIASLVENHATVIVENHPKFCGVACREFAEQLHGKLEVAIGLETAHAETLQWLNKRMTLDDYRKAVERLREWDIAVRSFVLLRPPGMSNQAGVEWSTRSVEFALECGARCVAIVPVRGGNGIMERLRDGGYFEPPSLSACEDAFDQALGVTDVDSQRVFIDLWDLERFSACDHCFDARRDRLHRMNLSQQVEARIACRCAR